MSAVPTSTARAGEGLDAGGQPAGQRGAAGRDADQDEGGEAAVGGSGIGGRGPLDELVGHAVDDAGDVGGGEQGAGGTGGGTAGRRTPGRLGRAGHQASFPASLDGSLKEWVGPRTTVLHRPDGARRRPSVAWSGPHPVTLRTRDVH